MSCNDNRKVFTTRVDGALLRAVKIKSAESDIPLQTIMDQALRLWVEKFDGIGK